jgi:ABC-type multidrug transport system fused ATPase/permease subunit
MMSESNSRRVCLLAALREILTLFGSARGLLAFILLVNLLGAALTGIGDPMSLKLLIDSLARKDLRFFLQLTGLMVLVYTSFRAITYVSDLYSQKLKNRICKDLTSRLVRNFYELPYSRVSRQDRGYFISRVYDEPVKVTTAVSLVVNLFNSLAICLCAAGVCFLLSWRVTLGVLLVVPFLILLSSRYGGRIRNSSLQENEAEAQLRDGLGRAVESYKNVRIFNLHDQVLLKFDQLLQSLLGFTYARYKQGAAFGALSGILLSSAETAVMIAAGIEVVRGHLSIGGLFGFVSAYWRIVNSFRNLIGLVPSAAHLAAQLERIHELEALPGLEQPRWKRVPQWRVRDLSVGFGERQLFSRFNFSTLPGERILVVGPNGSVKSTLAHILTGFTDAQEGEIGIPGLERTSALLSPFGFIPGSLRDNLAHVSASFEKQVAMEEMARLLSLAEKLDHDPASLSDGERRKAQVMMALAKDADFYILDEPLANIDPGSKDTVMNAIFSHTAGRSLIVILHGDDHYRKHFNRIIDLRQQEQAAASIQSSFQRVPPC